MPKVTGSFPGRLSPVQSTWAETMRISLGNIPLGQEAIRGAQKPQPAFWTCSCIAVFLCWTQDDGSLEIGVPASKIPAGKRLW
jgi:hypothetical protein